MIDKKCRVSPGSVALPAGIAAGAAPDRNRFRDAVFARMIISRRKKGGSCSALSRMHVEKNARHAQQSIAEPVREPVS
ncbi:MAG TPA: hypothetical protein PK799_08770 [Rhodocyclaceae bacterium]|nr:hypothetical protein [Rhodocyclaceae bacterium]HNC61714.1 hypothetical protein [Rhodocyclaceae bacterium]